MSRLASEEVDLGEDGSHPLPWYPPTCDPARASAVKLPARSAFTSPSCLASFSYVPVCRYSGLPGLRQAAIREKHPDDSIKLKMQESFGQGEGRENIAELGARLKSAREAAVWPGWLLNTAAANYWRVVGTNLRFVFLPFYHLVLCFEKVLSSLSKTC